MVIKRTLYQNLLPSVLLLLVFSANYILYHTTLGIGLLPPKPNLIVVGSMIDLAVISPILFLAWKRKLNGKNLILGVAGGLILVRFFIPNEFLAPFQAVTWAEFVVEGGSLLLEILVLVSLIKHLPRIINSVKNSSLPLLFSFSNALDHHMKANPLIRIICSEILIFYYAFVSWRKKTRLYANMFTLHQKSSLLAIYVMLIHATIIEMAGLHWWIHEKSIVLSIILLVTNLYTVVFIIGDIQAVRHNPVIVTNEGLYLSLGLTKRMEIKWSDVKEMIAPPKSGKFKPVKDMIEFIARDFEEVHPDFIIKLKHPREATFIMGIKKEYKQVALRLDEPERFQEMCRGNGF
jgi:hypothetical protein